ncbi:MAG: DsbA family protein [Prochlorotrichaceae cyanobacterium]
MTDTNFHWFRKLTGVTLLCLWLSIIPTGVSLADTISPELEQQVLEIIRKHPEVLIETLQRYQELQAQDRQNQRIDRLFNTVDTLIADSPTKGNAQSTLLLLELSDFQCPFCAASQVPLKQFLADHPEIKLIYKHFPLTNIHPEALDAARSAWAAHQQDQFWAYHDALFQQQDRLSAELYTEIAESLKLDLEQFQSDRDSPAALASIQADVNLGQQLGIEGTPLFVFYNLETRQGKYLYGARSAREFEAALEAVESNR